MKLKIIFNWIWKSVRIFGKGLWSFIFARKRTLEGVCSIDKRLTSLVNLEWILSLLLWLIDWWKAVLSDHSGEVIECFLPSFHLIFLFWLEHVKSLVINLKKINRTKRIPLPSSWRFVSTYNDLLLVRSLKTHLREVISALCDLLVLILHGVGCFVKLAQRQEYLCIVLISGGLNVVLCCTMLCVRGQSLNIAANFLMLLVLSLKKLTLLLGLFLIVLRALHHVLLLLDSFCTCNFFASLPLDVVLVLSWDRCGTLVLDLSDFCGLFDLHARVIYEKLD